MRQVVPEIPALVTSTPAAERVARFLAAIAPIDDDRLAARVTAILADMPAGADPATAVAWAQERLDSWWRLAFDDVERGDPHARRAMARLPDAFLSTRPGHLASLRKLQRQFAEPAVLTPQPLARSRMTAWARVLPMLLAGIGGAAVFAHAVNAPPILALPWAALFGLLLSLQVHAAVLAILGLVVRDGAARKPGTATLPPTAIVMPVYEEDPEAVFAALAAMREELYATGRAEHFAFYVLSDTQDALRAADEDRAWRRLAAMAGGKIPVYYRRRTANIGKKAGNLAEFAVRNAHRFTYAVILDADSVMGARTIVSMVEQMEENPTLGLLQSPIALRGGETLFARLLQLGHSVAGPLLFRGLGVWSGADGNYYGHNAVLRLRAFVDCCGLPTLQGSPPLGGPILSHDFV
jgi:membrane glycosyltransferase